MIKPILFLLGPTAVGKTAVAISLAERFPQLSLISVDSAMVYKRMNIGTGKPDAKTLAYAPHQLIDIREPWETYSAADFSKDATQAIDACHARGQIPLLVGGTFLYFRALEQGLSHLPAASPDVRENIQAKASAEGWPALHAELALIDPNTASRLSPQDSQRITRALEVYLLTGKPLSVFLSEHKSTAKRGRLSGTVMPFVLNTPCRAQLHTHIEQRFHDMMRQGLLEEVQSLLQEPQIHPALPSMRAVGYRQLIEYCQSNTNKPTQTLDAAVASGIAATRQLAKRQLTWLRSLPDIPHFTDKQALIAAIQSRLAPFLS
ncbi:MAG: MiaA [Pseudomonadota bacterium]|jgi:tRNA dimethylallyltransferase